MARRCFFFTLGDEQIAASLDDAEGSTGLLIVSGGNEIRSGAFSGQAQLAARIAARGFPVLRFDRRGLGDSSGVNRGFRSSGADIAAAAAEFRRQAPHLDRIVGFGNCDAASALALFGLDVCDALVLSNPWTFDEEQSDDMPASAIRHRYLRKLRSPHEIARLLRGKVRLGAVLRGLKEALAANSLPESELLAEIRKNLARYQGTVHILLAANDRTAQAFESQWDRRDPRIERCPDASHAYAEAHARAWLEERLLSALEG